MTVSLEFRARALAHLLAWTDTVLAPLRDWQPPRPARVWSARRHLRSAGARCEFTIDELQALPSLAADGLIELHDDRSARLTDTGDWTARYVLFGLLPSLPIHFLFDVSSRTREPARILADRWISEAALFDSLGFEPVGGEEGAILPLLAREWLVCNAQRTGVVWFAITSAGRAALAAPGPVAPIAERSGGAGAYYVRLRDHFDAALADGGDGGEPGDEPLPDDMNTADGLTMYGPD